MPIQKSKTLTNGVTGNYWRVIEIAIDTSKLGPTFPTTFELGLFIDKASSDASNTPIKKNKKYTFDFTRDELISGNLIGLGETKILAKANTLIDPIFPSMGAGQVYFDPDLAEGSIVA